MVATRAVLELQQVVAQSDDVTWLNATVPALSHACLYQQSEVHITTAASHCTVICVYVYSIQKIKYNYAVD